MVSRSIAAITSQSHRSSGQHHDCGLCRDKQSYAASAKRAHQRGVEAKYPLTAREAKHLRRADSRRRNRRQSPKKSAAIHRGIIRRNRFDPSQLICGSKRLKQKRNWRIILVSALSLDRKRTGNKKNRRPIEKSSIKCPGNSKLTSMARRQSCNKFVTRETTYEMPLSSERNSGEVERTAVGRMNR